MTAQIHFALAGWGWLLALGGLVATIPIVLHLLQTARAPELPFSSLRFLRASAERTVRRRRIQHWLLMLVRAGLLAVLAIALARPMWGGGWGDTGPESCVIVLDNSLSMATRDLEGSHLDRARAAAKKLLRRWDTLRQCGVVVTNGPLARQPVELLSDRGRLEQRLDTAEPGIGHAVIADQVRRALKAFDRHQTVRGMICVLTDMQQTALDPQRLGEALKGRNLPPVLLFDCSAGEAVSVGLTDLRVEGDGHVAGLPLRLVATVVNTSPAPQDVTVRLRVDNQTVEAVTERLLLAAAGSEGAIQMVTLPHTFDRAGWHVATVDAQIARDDLVEDNQRHMALRISDPPNVLIMIGDGSTGSEHAGSYVQAALRSANVAMNASVRTATNVPPSDVLSSDAVVLCDVPWVEPATADALDALVDRGGVVVTFPGPHVDPERYSEWVDAPSPRGRWLAARLGEATGRGVVRPDAEPLVRVDESSWLFSGLAERPGQYESVLLYRHLLLDPVDGSRSLAWLAGGDPLVVQRPDDPASASAGLALTFATTADNSWTNLPTQPIFLPVLVRAVLRPTLTAAGETSFLEGEWVSMSGSAVAAVEVQMPATGREPAGPTVRPTPPDEPNVPVVFRETYRAGAYRWHVVGAADLEGRFVVNAHPSESDLTRLSPTALAALRSNVLVADDADALQEGVAALYRGHPGWDDLLAVVLVLVAAEALLANRYRPIRRTDQVRPMASGAHT
ncbi:MAG TPA: BatA domain-containing protein [Phycisphaerae bacterium]|nr:BatA domain-containing protein [Phycisphaerae bacterium]